MQLFLVKVISKFYSQCLSMFSDFYHSFMMSRMEKMEKMENNFRAACHKGHLDRVREEGHAGVNIKSKDEIGRDHQSKKKNKKNLFHALGIVII